MSTKIFGITDSHQEARNLAALLSGIFEQTTEYEDFILLDCGDLFKGVYDPDLSVKLYTEFKKLRPNAKIFITLGNNDFGFNSENFEYLKKSIKKLQDAGIKFVCANLINLSDGSYSNLVPQYEILKINGTRLLITGFCLKTAVINNFGLDFEDYKTSFANLIKNIREDFDKIIVLNHHWYDYSKDLYEFAQSENIKISLITGGHEHSRIPSDNERKIFYPLAFARTLYRMELNEKIENIEELPVSNFKPVAQFESLISKYEKDVQLFAPAAKRVLNLWKRYSQPCPLGTFLSDSMAKIAKTDIAFHSTGMTMYHLKNDDSGVITNYDIKRTISAPTPIVKFKLNTSQLKEVLQNSVSKRMYINNGNSRFLQCSHNIEITGEENYKEKTFKIVQISINGKDLLDENAQPRNNELKFGCAADEFIANGGQGYDILKNIPKEKVLLNGKELKINELLRLSLINAQNEFTPETEYPPFVLNDISY